MEKYTNSQKLSDLLTKAEITPLKTNTHHILSENKPSYTRTRLTTLEDVKLTSWRTVVKNHRPKGTLAFLPKKTVNLIEEGIMNDFLVQRLDSHLILECNVEEGSKVLPAIPDKLIDEFNEWLG